MKIGQQLFYRHMNGSSLPPQKIKCHFPRLPKVCFWRSCPSKMCLWLPRYYPERNCPTLSDCTDKTSWEILELRGKKKRSPYACQLTLPRTMQFASHPLSLTLHPNFTGEVLLPCQLDIWTAEAQQIEMVCHKVNKNLGFYPSQVKVRI